MERDLVVLKKGRHGNIHFPRFTFNPKETYIEAEFNHTARYDLGDIDQLDWNKLSGLSWGFHHQNSFRIGWRYMKYNDSIEFCAYIYENGERKVYPFGPPLFLFLDNDPVSFFVKFLYEVDHIIVNGYHIPFVFPKCKVGYRLFPFYGGNEVCPHDIHIKNFKMI